MMIWFLLILASLYMMALVTVSLCFIYPFRTPIFLSPGFLGTAQEAVEFKDIGSGKFLRGWWVPYDEPKAVMICCHGFMMNRSELTPIAAKFKDLPMAFLFFDFPAHGGSQGRRSSFGLRERTAVQSAVALAKEKYPRAKILLIGSSMGAVASAFAASEDTTLADGLILDSCYDRLDQAIDGWWDFLGGKVLRFFLRPVVLMGWPLSGINPYSVVVSRKLGNVKIPTLMLHGGADILAPLTSARRNFDALAGPKTMVEFPGRNHSEARWEDPEKYFAAIQTFLDENHFVN